MQRGAKKQATINTQIHLLKYYQPFQPSPLQWQGLSVSVGGEIDNKKASVFMRIAASLVLVYIGHVIMSVIIVIGCHINVSIILFIVSGTYRVSRKGLIVFWANFQGINGL